MSTDLDAATAILKSVVDLDLALGHKLYRALEKFSVRPAQANWLEGIVNSTLAKQAIRRELLGAKLSKQASHLRALPALDNVSSRLNGIGTFVAAKADEISDLEDRYRNQHSHRMTAPGMRVFFDGVFEMMREAFSICKVGNERMKMELEGLQPYIHFLLQPPENLAASVATDSPGVDISEANRLFAPLVESIRALTADREAIVRDATLVIGEASSRYARGDDTPADELMVIMGVMMSHRDKLTAHVPLQTRLFKTLMDTAGDIMSSAPSHLVGAADQMLAVDDLLAAVSLYKSLEKYLLLIEELVDVVNMMTSYIGSRFRSLLM